MRNLTLVTIALAIGLSNAVAAAPTLTYDSVLRLARENSPVIRTAEARLDEAEGSLRSARALRTPSVDLVAGYQRMDDDLMFTTSDPEAWNIEVQATQRLYSGGNISGAIEQAQAGFSATEAAFQTTVQSVMLGVKEAWFAVLLSREEIGVREEALRLLEQQLQLVENRFEAGAVSRFELLRAQVAVANARPPLIRARNGYELSIVQLLRAIGLAVDEPAETNIQGELEFREVQMGLRDALSHAQQRRPEFQATRFQIEAAEASLKSSRSGRLPTLDAVVGYGWQRSPVSSSFDEADDGWRVGLQGSWNIWDGRATQGEILAASARLRQVEISLDDLDLQVASEVRQALLSLEEAIALVEASRAVAGQAEEALQLAQDRFAVGSAIQIEVLETQVALTEARTNEVQALYAYNLAVARFERAIGR